MSTPNPKRTPKPKRFLPLRPDKIPFYVGLGRATMPRYVWLKNNKNKYDGNGNLKAKL